MATKIIQLVRKCQAACLSHASPSSFIQESARLVASTFGAQHAMMAPNSAAWPPMIQIEGFSALPESSITASVLQRGDVMLAYPDVCCLTIQATCRDELTSRLHSFPPPAPVHVLMSPIEPEQHELIYAVGSILSHLLHDRYLTEARTALGAARRLSASPETPVDAILASLADAAKAANARLWVPSDDGEYLHLIGAINGSLHQEATSVAIDEPSLTAVSFKTGKLHIVHEAGDDGTRAERKVKCLSYDHDVVREEVITIQYYPGGSQDESAMAIPIVAPACDATFGVLVLTHSYRNRFDDQLAPFLAQEMANILVPYIPRTIVAIRDRVTSALRSELRLCRKRMPSAAVQLSPFKHFTEAALHSLPSCIAVELFQVTDTDPSHWTSMALDMTQAEGVSSLIENGVVPEWLSSMVGLLRENGTARGQQQSMRHAVCAMNLQFACNGQEERFAMFSVHSTSPPAFAFENAKAAFEAEFNHHATRLLDTTHRWLAEVLGRHFGNALSVADFFQSALTEVEMLTRMSLSIWVPSLSRKWKPLCPVNLTEDSRQSRFVQGAIHSGRVHNNLNQMLVPIPLDRPIMALYAESGSRVLPSQYERQVINLLSNSLNVFAHCYKALGDRDRALREIPHELRAPIDRIADRMTTLAPAVAHMPAVADDVEEIRFANEHNRLMVCNIVEVSSERAPFTKPTSLTRLKADVLEPVLSILRNKINDSGLDPTRVSIGEVTDLPEFNGNKGDLYQVFYNLLDNAIKYYRLPRPSFSVRCYCRPDQDFSNWWVIVEDHGIGVPPGWEETVFERGERAPNTGEREGLGLGLHVVRRIVAGWGGEVRLESSRNPTRFLVHFPTVMFPDGQSRKKRR